MLKSTFREFLNDQPWFHTNAHPIIEVSSDFVICHFAGLGLFYRKMALKECLLNIYYCLVTVEDWFDKT